MEASSNTVKPPVKSADKAQPTSDPTTQEASTSAPQREDWEVQRDHAKQQGDQAFRMGSFNTAIDHYSQAIELDPEFVLAYSNRSAAYLKNSEKSKALRDAEKVTELDPMLPKGWSRLGAALHALHRWHKALEAYQYVLDLDPQNAIAKKGAEDCKIEVQKMEEQQIGFAAGFEIAEDDDLLKAFFDG